MSKRPATIKDLEDGMVLFDAFDDQYQVDGLKRFGEGSGVVRLIGSRTIPAQDIGPNYVKAVWGSPVLYDLQFVLQNFRVIDLTDPIYSPQPPDGIDPDSE